MRILVGWDSPDEIDLLSVYLAVEDAVDGEVRALLDRRRSAGRRAAV